MWGGDAEKPTGKRNAGQKLTHEKYLDFMGRRAPWCRIYAVARQAEIQGSAVGSPIEPEMRQAMAKIEVRHICSFPGIPARVDGIALDGRSPDLRICADHLSSRETFAVTWPWGPGMTSNPLTVAGAVTVLVPFGWPSPCSLLIPLESS